MPVQQISRLLKVGPGWNIRFAQSNILAIICMSGINEGILNFTYSHEIHVQKSTLVFIFRAIQTNFDYRTQQMYFKCIFSVTWQQRNTWEGHVPFRTGLTLLKLANVFEDCQSVILCIGSVFKRLFCLYNSWGLGLKYNKWLFGVRYLGSITGHIACHLASAVFLNKTNGLSGPNSTIQRRNVADCSV